MSGYGAPALAGAPPGAGEAAVPAVAGYHTVVGKVRDDSVGRPAYAGVGRDGST